MQEASRSVFMAPESDSGMNVFIVEPGDDPVLLIRTLKLASGSKSFKVEWGDGSYSVFTASQTNLAHTYGRRGPFRIRISDDIGEFGYTGSGGTAVKRDMMREWVSSGSKLVTLSSYAFNNCHLMRGVFNFPNVTYIGGYAFGSALGPTEFRFDSLVTLSQN